MARREKPVSSTSFGRVSLFRVFWRNLPWGNWYPPKNGEIALWPSTNESIPYIVVLAGSASSFTEITEYNLISLLEGRADLQY